MEKTIAYHCAPALAGIKSANIVTFYKKKIKDIPEKLNKLNCELNGKGIYAEVLCECERRVVVMVYRRRVLEKTLNDKAVRAFLIECGYPKDGGCDEFIAFLKRRLKGKEFSHEIGAFLGYPVHDIYGFMHHKSEGCLLCGEWKVYADEENARALFHRFDRCRRALYRRIASGQTLAEVLC